jgi:glucosamine 6-phosphate synthetase-like amidotransferase/phosphosugar isomerase protein
VREVTKNIYWIGSDQFCKSDETYLGGSTIDDENYSCILDSSVLQLLANQLAVAKGLNPDAPKGLNKVTITL